MYLSKVEIFGFKSFPQRTELLFDNGITAIVGPNGCGKTNILDAIRWSMGEQRPSILRGGKMDEVIFNGSLSAKPLGLAEVTLTIDNDYGILPTEYRVVQITRRLYRSGASEYLLNQVPCRLKDIIDLFLDTGMGAHAYNIIQPEMVDAILSPRAEDRRELFEEAAGVAKYKLRRKEAELKLEATEADLVRLCDIKNEVQTRVNSLSRQVKKAERYQKTAEGIQRLELLLAREEYEKIQRTLTDVQNKHAQVTHDESQLSLELSTAELQVENFRTEELEIQQSLQAVEQQLTDLRQQEESKTEALSQAQKKAAELQSEIQHLTREIDELVKKDISLDTELKQLSGQQQADGLETAAVREELQVSENKLVELLEQVFNTKTRASQAQAQLLGLESSVGIVKGDVGGLASRREELQLRAEQLKEQILELEKRAIEIEQARQVAEQFISRVQARIESQRQQVHALAREIAVNQTAIEELQKTVADSELHRSGIESRRELFAQMMNQYEGYQSGVKAILQTETPIAGIIDTVANLLQVEDQHQRAVEAALGEAAQCVLCHSKQSAQEAIRYLKSNKLGRASFLPLDRIPVRRNGNRSVVNGKLNQAGVYGWAADLARVSPEYEDVLKTLLGDVLIVENAEVAWEIANQPDIHYDIATLDGHVLRAAGAIDGGEMREVALVGREQTLAQLVNQLASLEQKIQRNQQKANVLGLRNQELKESILALQTELESLEKEWQHQVLIHEKTGIELGANHYQQNNLRQELAETDTRIRQLAVAQEDSAVGLSSLIAERDQARSLTEQVTFDLERLESQEKLLTTEVNRLRITLVSHEGRLEQIQYNIQRLQELRAEIDRTIQTKRQTVDDAQSHLTKVESQSRAGEQELFSLKQAEADWRQKKHTSEQTLDQKRQARTLLEAQLKRIRLAKDETTSRKHELELELADLTACSNRIVAHLRDDLELSQEHLTPLTDQERIAVGEATKKIVQLRQNLKNIGPVNLLALEEYKTQKQRFDFLNQQLSDLLLAKQQLSDTIARINQTAREKFEQTFARTQENFKRLFSELFEGGQADITFATDGDPLESDITIAARPKGKRPVNISQLSGGERALTAIALLFALYLVKPSPFCILDEIDAPLDDANIERFLKMIRQFSAKTQFIIITHNKKTMEVADILYGVTMEEPGISKLVSVKLSADNAGGSVENRGRSEGSGNRD